MRGTDQVREGGEIALPNLLLRIKYLELRYSLTLSFSNYLMGCFPIN
jgi:hypothetical protein